MGADAHIPMSRATLIMTRTIFDKAAVSVALAVMAASLERDVVVRQALPTRLVILRAAERAAGGRIGPVVEASLPCFKEAR